MLSRKVTSMSNSSTTQANQPVSMQSIIPSAEYRALRKVSISRLISEQRCTMLKDKDHTIVVYGDCLNILDPNRQWLFDRLWNQRKDSFRTTGNPAAYPDVEKLEILANKAVLYVSENDLEAMIKLLSREKVHAK